MVGDGVSENEAQVAADGDNWTLGTAIKQADDFLASVGLPRISRPDGHDKEYDFPADLPSLTSTQLGLWQSRMERFWAYGMQTLGKEDSELQEIEGLYEIRVAQRMQEEAGKMSGKVPVKDILRAVAIKSDPKLEALTRTLIARRLRVKRLDTQVRIYQSHLVRLSREQSRREAESRTG